MSLEQLIKNKKAKVTIIGLGYVGLPTAFELAKVGYQVFGIDKDKEKVDFINQGKSYIKDINSKELKKIVSSKKLKVYDSYKVLKDSDIVLICLPTPLDKNKVPDVSYIKIAAEEIAKYLHKEQLIILESSSYPGTTREIILAKLEKKGFKIGKDFFLVFSPERIDPGNKKYKFKNISRVVGGITKKCTQLATKFYKSFINTQVLSLSSPEVAEMTKLLENTFRLVNISMINELSLLSSKMGIDIWEVIEAAKSKPFGFFPFYPSPKVGGHCCPLDPFYLSWKAKEYNFNTRFIDIAGDINEQMPHFVVTKVILTLNLEKKAIRGSKVLILGVSYKKDIGDTRESAAIDIIPNLQKKGAKVDYFDSYVKNFEVQGKNLKSIKYKSNILKNY
ncbi:MAG TPA: nucleotide sugar dehydrogenase, partial [bacterium]|nr:nucleotide sugar dehydrogenase [bacterium]